MNITHHETCPFCLSGTRMRTSNYRPGDKPSTSAFSFLHVFLLLYVATGSSVAIA